tara:strand:+ start:253 stop:369 length:117 start_codon:yes stop_codon:yes gene_type:complete
MKRKVKRKRTGKAKPSKAGRRRAPSGFKGPKGRRGGAA